MANTLPPYPNNTKFLELNDVPGGPSYQLTFTIDSNGNLVPVSNQFASSINNPSVVGEQLLSTTLLINLNSAAEQTLYTVPFGRSCVPIRFVVRTASTSLTTVSFGIGFNAATDNDILATATHTELTGPTLSTALLPKIGAKIGVAGTNGTLALLCTILQGGAATCTIDTYGMLI